MVDLSINIHVGKELKSNISLPDCSISELDSMIAELEDLILVMRSKRRKARSITFT